MPTNEPTRTRGPVIVAAILCVVLAVVAAVSAYNAVQLRAQLQQTDAEFQQLTARTKPSHLKSADDPAKLRELLRQAEDNYAQLRVEYEKLKGGSAPTAEPAPATGAPEGIKVPTPAGNQRGGGGPNMEKLKETDPERYKQIMADREKQRQQVAAQFKDQMDRLNDRLQAAQTPDEVSLLTQLSQTVQHIDELRQAWQGLRDLPEDQRSEQAAQLRQDSMQTYQQLADLRGKDRALQLQQLAAQVGYTDPKTATQFVDSVNRIVSETDASINRMLGFGRGGPGGDRGGSGGPGPQPPPPPTTTPAPTPAK